MQEDCDQFRIANGASPLLHHHKGMGATTRTRVASLRLQLHGAIYRPDSFVLMLRYCVKLKAIRYESTSFNRIVADKSHRVIAA